MGERHLGEVPTGGVHDPLRLRRGARGVEDVEQLLGVHRFGRTVIGRIGHEVVPPVVPALDHHGVGVAAVHDHHVLDRGRAGLECGVDVRLERARLAPSITGIGGDDELGFGILATVGDGVGREAAEDHRMGHADPRARQHRDRELDHHRHVDGDPVALLEAEPLQHVGELLDLGEQLGVGDGERVAGLALPVVGDLVPVAGLHVPVEAVVGQVELAADEPLGERKVPFEDGVEVLGPGQQLPGLASPERLEVGVGFVIHRPVIGICLCNEFGRRREPAVFALVDLDRALSHFPPPSRSGSA